MQFETKAIKVCKERRLLKSQYAGESGTKGRGEERRGITSGK